jgi:prepilin-type N-terminal cleavage/methylation domain-containing protein
MNQDRAGFTLIELLTVITIIAIIMGMVIGAGQFAKRKSLVSRAQTELEQIATALNEYQARNGIFPTAVTNVSKYLAENMDFVDPWKNEYLYSVGPQNMSYSLHSRGPNPADDFTADDVIAGR